MSLSGVGQPFGTVPLPLTPAAQGQSAANPDTASASGATPGALSFFTDLDFERPSTQTAGLQIPQDGGDSEALLAEVSLLLAKQTAQSRSNRDEALTGSFTSALGGLFANFAALDALANQAIKAAGQKAQDQTDLTKAQSQLTTDQATLTTANASLATASTNLAFWNQQVASINPTTDPTGYANAVAQQGAAAAQVGVATAQVQAATTAVNKDNTKIAGLNADITTQTNLINTANASYFTLQSALLVVFAPIASSLTSQQPVNAHDDRGSDAANINELDKLFNNLQLFAKSAQSQQEQLAVNNRIALDKATTGALGLAAGLSNVLSTLGQLPQTVTGPDATDSLSAGSRLKLSL
jgi:hypothetical protein